MHRLLRGKKSIVARAGSSSSSFSSERILLRVTLIDKELMREEKTSEEEEEEEETGGFQKREGRSSRKRVGFTSTMAPRVLLGWIFQAGPNKRCSFKLNDDRLYHDDGLCQLSKWSRGA